MSWIIGQYLRELPYIKEKADINSDSYNNAIMIEKTIDDMNKDGLLTEFEKNVLISITSGYNFSEISRILNADRQRVSQTFKNVTDRIAYIMGGEFTDAAFIERIQSVEPISEQHISKLFKRGLIKVEDL